MENILKFYKWLIIKLKIKKNRDWNRNLKTSGKNSEILHDNLIFLERKRQ